MAELGYWARAKLIAASTTAEDRIYPIAIPQSSEGGPGPTGGPELPACTYHVISDVRDATKPTRSNVMSTGLVELRLQVVSWAYTYKEARVLDAEVLAALRDIRENYQDIYIYGTYPETGRDWYDQDVKIYSVRRDFRIQFKEVI